MPAAMNLDPNPAQLKPGQLLELIRQIAAEIKQLINYCHAKAAEDQCLLNNRRRSHSQKCTDLIRHITVAAQPL